MQSYLQVSQSVLQRDLNSNFLLISQDVDPAQSIQIQLSTENISIDNFDLDLQCVLLNEFGQSKDVVFQTKHQLKNNAIILSQDFMGNGSQSSQTLSITLKDISFDIKYLVILDCSFKSQFLKSIETNSIVVTQQGKLLQSYQFSGTTVEKGMAAIPCIFQRQLDRKWTFTIIEEIGEGKNFKECEDLIKRGLTKVQQEGNKQQALSKNKDLPIIETLKILSVGLGWKTHCDVDCSVLLFDNTNQFLENVCFSNPKNSNGSVILHGDNITGQGEGDKEVITIDLQKIPNNVKTIWVVNTIGEGFSFKDISCAFCRLFSQDSKKQFCILNLSELTPDNKCNGNIMCCITRCKDSQWNVSPKGYFTRNTTMSLDLIKIIKEIQSNIFTKVIIVPQKNSDFLINYSQNNKDLNNKNILSQIEYQWEYQIEIQSAIDLGDEKNNDIINPYVSCKINEIKVNKTNVIPNTHNPTWNNQFMQKLTLGDLIEFKIKSKTLQGGNKYLGSCFYDVNQELFEERILELQLEVMNESNQDQLSSTLFVRFMKATRR